MIRVINDGMCIRATETKRVDRSSAGSIARPEDTIDRELESLSHEQITYRRRIYLNIHELGVDVRIETLKIRIGWDQAVLQYQDSLDDTRDAACTF